MIPWLRRFRGVFRAPRAFLLRGIKTLLSEHCYATPPQFDRRRHRYGHTQRLQVGRYSRGDSGPSYRRLRRPNRGQGSRIDAAQLCTSASPDTQTRLKHVMATVRSFGIHIRHVQTYSKEFDAFSWLCLSFPPLVPDHPAAPLGALVATTSAALSALAKYSALQNLSLTSGCSEMPLKVR